MICGVSAALTAGQTPQIALGDVVGLPPIIGGRPTVLILGNAPSVLSLATQQSYGNPRNSFWRITGELFGFDPAAPYAERTAALIERGIAVWDVLQFCRRTGSLDSAVEPDSMVPNDFDTFFTGHPTLRRVFFTGGAAEANYRRLVRVTAELTYTRLPSTSPAHTMALAAKLAAWRAALEL
ncbi:DNA-deoxyinosine glycosylase [soil metagenome]